MRNKLPYPAPNGNNNNDNRNGDRRRFSILTILIIAVAVTLLFNSLLSNVFSAGEKPYLSLRLKKGEDALRAARALVADYAAQLE